MIKNSIYILLSAAFLAFAVGAPVSAERSAATPEAAVKKRTAKKVLWKWFRILKRGLTQSSNQGLYRRARVTAVAAVRGAGQSSFDPEKPSWKGGREARRAAREKIERAEFETAADLILAGKMDEGLEALKKFETTHPKSLFLPDVRDALAKLVKYEETRRKTQAQAERDYQLAP